MSILDTIEIVCADVRDVPCDLLVLKYADGLYGADFAVADRLSIDIHVPSGHTIPGPGIKAAFVLFRGVGDLFDFRYAQIRDFSRTVLLDIRSAPITPRIIATTIHGSGYGLDEREAFMSQLDGYMIHETTGAPQPDKILIVEQDAERSARLQVLLEARRGSEPQPPVPAVPTPQKSAQTIIRERDRAPRVHIDYNPPQPYAPAPAPPPIPEDWTEDRQADGFDQFTDHGLLSDPFGAAPAPPIRAGEKPKLFAAMPFADKYLDEYHIAFVESAHAHDFLCERLDLENYVGDVIDEIFRRISASAGVLALLNENNPNVFLEVGYAMALRKPVILVARDDLDVAFDLASQRRQTYTSIYKLREDLTGLIGDLKANGTLI